MGDSVTSSETRKAGKPPVSAHPAFPAIAALWFAALFGIGFLVLPAALLESMISATGLASIVPAAAPPLGVTARLLLGGAAGILGAGLGFFLARKVAGIQSSPRDKNSSRKTEIDTGKPSETPDMSPPQPLNVDDLDSERFDPPQSEDEPEKTSEDTPVREFGRGPFLPGRRRALAVHDESGPSEFLYTVPLPGAAHSDAVGDFHADNSFDVAALLEAEPQEPVDGDSLPDSALLENDDALELGGFAAPQEDESDDEDMTRPDQTLDALSALRNSASGSNSGKDSQPAERQIFGAAALEAAEPEQESTILDATSSAPPSTYEIPKATQAPADRQIFGQPGPKNVEAEPLIDPQEATLQASDVALPRAFDRPDENDSPNSETAHEPDTENAAPLADPVASAIAEADEFEADADSSDAAPLVFAAPSLAADRHGDAVPASDDDEIGFDQMAEHSETEPNDTSEADPDYDPDAPLAELGMMALLERLGRSLRDNPQSQSAAKPEPEEPVAQPVIPGDFAAFQIEEESKYEDDGESIDLSSFDLSRPLDVMQTTDDNTVAGTPILDQAEPPEEMPERPAGMIPIAFDEDFAGDDEFETDDGDHGYSSILAMNNPFADAKPNPVRIDLPEEADEDEQPMVVFPNNSDVSSQALPPETAQEHRASEPNNTIPFARADASTSAKPVRPKLDFEQSEQALRAALANLQRNQSSR